MVHRKVSRAGFADAETVGGIMTQGGLERRPSGQKPPAKKNLRLFRVIFKSGGRAGEGTFTSWTQSMTAMPRRSIGEPNLLQLSRAPSFYVGSFWQQPVRFRPHCAHIGYAPGSSALR